MGPSSKNIVLKTPASACSLHPGAAAKPALARVLLAATCAGLLASSMLLFKEKAAKDEHRLPSVLLPAAAQVLQRCAMALPDVQKSLAAPILNRWAAPWLVANAALAGQDQQHAQDDLCTQLFSASLQGPNDAENGEVDDFVDAMEDTQATMVAHIAAQLPNNEALAKRIAPLVGVESEDVEGYLRSLVKKSPFKPQASGSYPSV